jgi:hypothetical protein
MNAAGFESLVKEHPTVGVKILQIITRSVVDRIRFVTDQYRRNIQWGMSVSGTLKLSWQSLITDEVDIRLSLVNSSQVHGKFLKVEETKSGYDLFVETKDDKVHIVPYHAVLSTSFHRHDSRQRNQGEES